MTGPVVAPVGTGTEILVSLQELGVDVRPLNVTVLDPCDEPNSPPLMVTVVPSLPVAGDKLEMNGNRISGIVTVES